ncbi:serine carboxypeptidase-like 18 isoform X5 [Malus sylvestris]|uniref:serine carboxypeptidase-like 18 isoform X5 n=1 Tax=Malus sylvestris TaxID=3752 RepID=UPI0021AD16AB|nr:serine carboxypeptidase-like 18 isoform X5 [Malus sylvestris]
MLPQALLLVVLLNTNVASTSNIITALPGFPGSVPFKLETGYVGVGDMDDVQLFYYFIESEGSPEYDPLVLWLTGGPGCSAFSALVYEIGPLSFDYVDSIGNKPKLKLNPYSWTKVANIIFVDAPVGTGFSYAKTWRGYANMSDTLSAAQTYEFLRKWLMDHPKFFNNPLYIAGDSYSGVVIPLIVQEISDGNLDDNMPPMNVKGYVLGNPATDPKKDENSRILFAYLKALISDELYQSLETNCNGDYVNVDPYNALCVVDLEIYNECTEDIRSVQILEPSCTVTSPKSMGSIWNPDHLSDRDSKNILLTSSGLPRPWCREYNYIFSEIWANDKTVQDALHVQEGSIEEWMRCNKSLEDSNINDVSSSLVYHENLIKQGYRVLIYSGDHDMVVPYVGTLAWIELLNLTVDSRWRPWFVSGQIAGYSVQYSHITNYKLTFTTIKGAGHTAPEYKPEECLAMINRWFAYYPL